jgi:micrococcal nuclease
LTGIGAENVTRHGVVMLVVVVGVAGVALAVAVAVAVAVIVVGSRGDGGADLPDHVGVVLQVVDGDTFDLEIGGRTERVRLIGIDTPEIAHAEGGSDDAVDECYGPEARDYLRSELPAGTEVRLSRDIVGRDDYGRLLAYVHRRTDDVFVNEALVAGGYARVMTIEPNDTFHATFVAAARSAHAADRGLWAACTG